MKYLAFLFLLPYFFSNGQSQTKSVLFLGNSYTGFNDLPVMLFEEATSCGDDLIYDSNTPGGYTLQGHSSNSTTLSKIAAGNWDYVVLQEQSQLPSFPNSQVEANVFPYARKLDSLIKVSNPCAETVFYMTWGRKNGDSYNCQNWPPVCTYQGMDSLLNLRYRIMADTNDAILSPVGAVWNYIRSNYPNIELYDPDESHPSVAGTFAAACTFYASIYRNDPTLIGFNPGLNSTDAENIKQAVKLIVYQDLTEWHIGEYDPNAHYSSSQSGPLEISFTNVSTYADSYQWDFGDGSSSTVTHPTHSYAAAGTYQVTLIASNCGKSDISTGSIVVNAVSVAEKSSYDFYLIMKDGTLILSSDDLKTNVKVEIINAAGVLIYSGKFNGTSEVINTSNFSKGLYFLVINHDEKISHKKFLKQE